jgi:hypothetical protein
VRNEIVGGRFHRNDIPTIFIFHFLFSKCYFCAISSSVAARLFAMFFLWGACCTIYTHHHIDYSSALPIHAGEFPS